MTQRFEDDPAAIPGSLMIRKAIIRAYTAATHKADLQIVGSHPTLAAGLRVATNIPAADVVPGRQATVLLLDPSNPDDAVIVAVQGALPSTVQGGQASGGGLYEDSRVMVAFRDNAGTVTLRRLHTLPFSSLVAATKVVVAI